MSRTLSAGLGKKVEKAKKDLDYGSKILESHDNAKRGRQPKNFTIAKENGEWLDKLTLEMSMRLGKKLSTSSVINAIIDKARINDEQGETIEFLD